MPAKPLTPAQKADAMRLKAFFTAWQADRKARGLPHAQGEIAQDLFGFGQSALSQYLNGHIPMNPEVVQKFASVLGVGPSAINPTITQAAQEQAKEWLQGSVQARTVRAMHPSALDVFAADPTTLTDQNRRALALVSQLHPLALDAAIQLNEITDPARQRRAYALFVRALERSGLTAAPAATPSPDPAPAPIRKRVTSR